MRLVVDLDLCQGHAVCRDEAPELFHVPGQGQVEILRPDPGTDLEAARTAVRYCPTQALSLIADPANEGA
ncbi:ferredoxin [Nocardia seriolae]|uniref:Ferredoxin n=1 Tax=Nocardia seriolae TaxID=37332 RepID=A0A0B8NKU1_9NOCA|nr:ferredoxin [Nocardia seriolae]MTJ60348.1 ferredoxin [Nocardia seriolae]MTJ74474.1 ferredoxin [Nocardia seriolae]MTJ84814.1 ferredoxin [Nocardia seriolae]MTK28803.1 ferredoxin [Nocardia seriolae]MTK38277.1 ferredoxin [Nocardia seriolae]